MAQDDAQGGEAEARHAAARAVLSALSGAASTTPTERTVRQWQDRGAAGQEGARALLWAEAQRRVLPGLVADAVSADAAPVLLSDGTPLSRAQALRTLHEKEQARVFVPLRRALEDAAPKVRRFYDRGSEFEARVAELTAGWRPSPDEVAAQVVIDTALQAFLSSTADAGAAALMALSGDAPALDPHGFARAYDAPDVDGGFSVERGRALLQAARAAGQALPEAAPTSTAPGSSTPRTTRKLVRTTAPRTLWGRVLDDGGDAVRVLSAGATRATGYERLEGFLDDVEGGLRGLLYGAPLRGLWPRDARVDGDDDDAPNEGLPPGWLGSAAALSVGLGLSSAAVRRTALGEGRTEAERCGRLAFAAALLRARVAAALSLALAPGDGDGGDEGLLDRCREGLTRAVGVDVGVRFIATRLDAPLPWAWQIVGSRRGAWQAEALARAVSSTLWRSGRDGFDEAFALEEKHWREAPGRLEEEAAQARSSWRAWAQALALSTSTAATEPRPPQPETKTPPAPALAWAASWRAGLSELL